MKTPLIELTGALTELVENLNSSHSVRESLFRRTRVDTLLAYLLRAHQAFFAKTWDVTNIDVKIMESSPSWDNCKAILNLNKLMQVHRSEDLNQDRYFYAHAWLMQQFIRNAINDSSLLRRELYHPFLEIAIRDLLKNAKVSPQVDDGVLKLEIVGDAGGVWLIEKRNDAWLLTDRQMVPTNLIYLDQQVAWLLFSGILDVKEIGQYVQIIGNHGLALYFLTMRFGPDILGDIPPIVQ